MCQHSGGLVSDYFASPSNPEVYVNNEYAFLRCINWHSQPVENVAREAAYNGPRPCLPPGVTYFPEFSRTWLDDLDQAGHEVQYWEYGQGHLLSLSYSPFFRYLTALSFASA